MKHILYLPSWFPNRRDPFPGDFILRHAQAASLYNNITVFCTIPDKEITKTEMIKEVINENLRVWRYYYPAKSRIFSSFFNGVIRWKALRKFYKQEFNQKAPDLVHVHVAWPAGLFALYLKRAKGLKYIISEHDGIYMPGYDNYHIPGTFEKKMVPIIYKNARKIHAVSNSLATSLFNLRLANFEPVVIPNVVDINNFNYKEKKRGNYYRFIHVSSLINQKNPEGMLEALSIVKLKRQDFILKIIGPAKEKLKNLIKDFSLEKQVMYTGVIPYNEVANEIKNSDAMIHFTRYETFGCVLAESLCSGVPVIVSDIDVTRELITDKVNGLLVKENDVKDLADKILYFMETDFQIDARQIATENQKKFNYQRIGKLFNELYNSVIFSR